MSPSNSSKAAPDLRIQGDRITLVRSQVKEDSRSTDAGRDEILLNHMARFRTDPIGFLRELGLHLAGTEWRGYDEYIGQRIFYPEFSKEIKDKVIESPSLQGKIYELADLKIADEEKQGLLDPAAPDYTSKMASRRETLVQQLHKVVDKMLDGMICKLDSKYFIRGAYWVTSELTLRAYGQGIRVNSEEILRLKQVAEEAEKKKQSILFLPCHRSHVDYVALQLLCYRLGLALPIVVAGDNLNFPIVGGFLQRAGAMYIRRSFGDDQLYSTVVQSYIDILLQGGYNLECFIEGGRSRTGKLLPPKFGILSYVLDSLLSGRIEDVVVCPVSIQYDRVIETEGYTSELLGAEKKKENLKDFVGSASVLKSNFGSVDVRFKEPWSLRSFVEGQLAQLALFPSRFNVDWEDERNNHIRQALLRTLGYRVLNDINSVSVIMPTALIGTVLLTMRGRGIGMSELVRRVNWLSERIRANGGRVAHFGDAPTAEVIARGLSVLGKKLVHEADAVTERTFKPADKLELAYYRNMTIHLFIPEALVCAALYTQVKQGGGPAIQDMMYQTLYDQVQFLSSLLRGEFIYASKGLEKNLQNTLERLERDQVIYIQRDDEGKFVKVGLHPAERKAGRENFDFYCFLVWPFIDSYWAAAVSIMGLTPPIGYKDNDIWIQLSKAQKSAQQLAKVLYDQGDLSYEEAMNKQTISNGFKRFEEEGIIQVIRTRDTQIPPRLRIAPEWRPGRDEKTGSLLESGRFWDFVSRISVSRREGKDRRDGPTVNRRVLAHTDSLGHQLFMEAVQAQTEEEQGKKFQLAPARLTAEEKRSLEQSIREQRRRRKSSRARL